MTSPVVARLYDEYRALSDRVTARNLDRSALREIEREICGELARNGGNVTTNNGRQQFALKVCTIGGTRYEYFICRTVQHDRRVGDGLGGFTFDSPFKRRSTDVEPVAATAALQHHKPAIAA